jgi:hypothetical protein
MPSVLEVLYKKKLADTKKILTIVKIQYEKKIDVISACKELGIWNEQLEHLVIEEIKKERFPLGNILLTKKYIDIDTLTTELDNFLSLKMEKHDLSPIVEEEKNVVPTEKVEEFKNMVSNDKIEELKNVIKGLDFCLDDPVLKSESFKVIVKEFIDLTKVIETNDKSDHGKHDLFEMFQNVQKMIVRFIKKSEQVSSDHYEIFSNVLNEVLDMYMSAGKYNPQEKDQLLKKVNELFV